MKMFKKIIFLILVANCTNLAVFGMERKERVFVGIDEELRKKVDAKILECTKLMTPFFVVKNDDTEVQREECVIDVDQYDNKELRSALLSGDVNKIIAILKTIPVEQRAAFVMVVRNEYDDRVLDWALSSGYSRSVVAILESIPAEQIVGIVMARSQKGQTVLHRALSGLGIKNADGIRILLNAVPVEQRGKFILIKDLLGVTALDYVASNFIVGPEASAIVMKIILDAIPAEQRIHIVTAMNCHGATVLHYAIRRCGIRREYLNEIEDDRVVSVMRALLSAIPMQQRAAAVMARDYEGKTVLDEAKEYGLEKIISMLAEFYPQQLAPAKVEEEKERPSKKRNHDGEDGDSGVPAPKVREKEQPKESGWGCNVM